jgi:predicted transcriptional regulator
MVCLEAEQDRVVKRLAREMKTSESEVIRRAITAYGDADAAKLVADKRRLREYVETHPEGWPDDPAEWFRG